MMIQTKFFSADTQINLEKAVSNFIIGKDVINISYTIAPNEFYMYGERSYQVANYKHCCCVMYEE